MIGNILTAGRYERILKLLDQERRVILNGPLSELTALVERREAALAEVLAAESEVPQAFVMALKTRADRNARLLQASVEGVKAATSELAKIEESRDKLRTYTAEGASVDVQQTKVTRDQRA